MRRALLGSLVPIAFLSASIADAAPVQRHVVRIDIVEIAAGTTPRARHLDLVLTDDGALATRSLGADRLSARWTERQDGKPSITVSLDRIGTPPLHWSSRLRPLLGVPQFRFASSTKGRVTEVFVTVM